MRKYENLKFIHENTLPRGLTTYPTIPLKKPSRARKPLPRIINY